MLDKLCAIWQLYVQNILIRITEERKFQMLREKEKKKCPFFALQ
uniref:Uncharacterized protein n=1 Tax=Arundo donax TaxID=35708 RepID=A0A0A9B2G9_ARUDO